MLAPVKIDGIRAGQATGGGTYATAHQRADQRICAENGCAYGTRPRADAAA
jgi:hypothetical protein